MTRRWLPVCVALLVGCQDTSVQEPGRGQSVIDSSLSDEVLRQLATFESFEFDFNLESVDGQMVALQDYRGKIVIVDFWGTWCGPCREALPHLGDIYQKYHERGLEVLGINYEQGERKTWAPVVRQFVEKNSIAYTCLLGDEATRNRVPEFEGFPTMLFIDATGNVRYRTVGVRPYSELEAVVETLIKQRDSQAGRPDRQR